MLRWNAIEIIICWDSSPNTTFLVRQFRQLAIQYPHGQPVFEHFWTSILFPAEVADRQSISVSDLPAVAGEAEAFLELPFPAAAAYRTYIFIYSRRGAWVETWHYP